MNLWADAVLVDFAANAIGLRVPGLDRCEASTGVLDVGANGRLLGVEINETYITVMESSQHQESYTRSTVVALTISGDDPAYVAIPRRGSGYEITYPSGNECWQLTTVDGQLIQVCAVIGDARVEPAGGFVPEKGSRL
jgi:hypothetical protein